MLNNSFQKIGQWGLIDFCISDHSFIYCIRKTPSLKLDKRNDITIKSMKNYTKERYLELLRISDLTDYATFTCLIKLCQDFSIKLSEVIDLLFQRKKLRLKANSRPWIDSETISSIRRKN